ncbi:hypothetical protein NMY22_g2282 [Coprinellus aureogranulatus]|nr:hypothetical protein NMY22_g2282 [Coprinellus aureogranulatus]
MVQLPVMAGHGVCLEALRGAASPGSSVTNVTKLNLSTPNVSGGGFMRFSATTSTVTVTRKPPAIVRP